MLPRRSRRGAHSGHPGRIRRDLVRMACGGCGATPSLPRPQHTIPTGPARRARRVGLCGIINSLSEYMSSTAPPQARHWRSAAAALELLGRRPELTRRDLATELGLGSGATSDLVGRLRATRLVAERPVASGRPGRPTTRLQAPPGGPGVLA